MKTTQSHLVVSQRKKRTTLTFIVSVCFLFIAMYFELAVGAAKLNFNDFIDYFIYHKETRATLLIHHIRVPRLIGGMLIGAALAVAGLLMQAMTRNPLASPQIFGVNAGASFVVVLITLLIPQLTHATMLLAFIGAFVGGLTVYVLSGATKGMTPVKLALAGMTVHLFFASLTQGMILLDEDKTAMVLFWLVGTLHTMKWHMVLSALPWIVVALCLTMLSAKQITILALGETMSKSLGQNTHRVRILVGLFVIVLAGASVAIAGPIGFVGLIVPHIVKYYVPHNYHVMIPLTMIMGSTLLLLSDVLSRLIAFPFESPVGIVTSFLGAVYFLAFTLRGGRQHG